MPPREGEERRKVGEVPVIFQTTVILEVIKQYPVQREPWMHVPEVFLWWLRRTLLMPKVTLLCESCKSWPLGKIS